jgi:DNA-binding response OmpR family regulator
MPALSIVICSAQASTGDVVAGLMAGADQYLRTPISAAELTARVEAILCRIQPDRQAVLRARCAHTTSALARWSP